MEKEQLVKVADTVMSFDRYRERRLIDVPEEYLLRFARKDEFPPGRLDGPTQVMLLTKVEGLTQLVQLLERPF